MRYIILITVAIMSFVFYQNCSEELNSVNDGIHSERPKQKTLSGVVDLSKPVNFRPSRMYQAAEEGLDIDMASGEVLRDPTGNWEGLCLDSDLIKEVRNLLKNSEVCQEVPVQTADAEVVCTMEFNYPHTELYLSLESGKVSLGEGNECPRKPTQLCNNNEALVALIGTIEDRHFQTCL